MQKALLQSPFRYIPFSNPYYQLIAALLTHTRNRNVPMSTTLDELEALTNLEPSPPAKRAYNPSPEAKAAAEIGRKKDRKEGQRQRYDTPSKFANVPPNPLYIFDGRYRRVNPYNYTYNTFCKERWRGKTLIDIFLSEFRDRPAEYYVSVYAPCTLGSRLTVVEESYCSRDSLCLFDTEERVEGDTEIGIGRGGSEWGHDIPYDTSP